MNKNGRITACECQVVQRGGAYAGYGIITILYAGSLLHGLYDIPAVKYDGYRVYANLPPCGAMRGHGSVDTRHAFENLLDRMARELGLDPFAVRRANLLQEMCIRDRFGTPRANSRKPPWRPIRPNGIARRYFRVRRCANSAASVSWG